MTWRKRTDEEMEELERFVESMKRGQTVATADSLHHLGELYRDYHAKGLEIVGLMFENDPDPIVSIPRIRTFVKRYDAKYPMLLAGTTNPSPTTKTIAGMSVACGESIAPVARVRPLRSASVCTGPLRRATK